MTRERLKLNSMMVLHVHRNLLNDIQDALIVDEFVACNEMRKDIIWSLSSPIHKTYLTVRQSLDTGLNV